MNKPNLPTTCQNKEQAQTCITAIGDTNRKIEHLKAQMNDEIAKITAKYAERLILLQELSVQMTNAVQSWCADNKDKLLTDGAKTANLITGEVVWRKCPPSVVGKSTPELIARLERFGLDRFVRVKKELDKQAILKEPSAIANIEGISVQDGKEEIIIRPFGI